MTAGDSPSTVTRGEAVFYLLQDGDVMGGDPGGGARGQVPADFGFPMGFA